jgi:hypothetical protein
MLFVSSTALKCSALALPHQPSGQPWGWRAARRGPRWRATGRTPAARGTGCWLRVQESDDPLLNMLRLTSSHSASPARMRKLDKRCAHRADGAPGYVRSRSSTSRRLGAGERIRTADLPLTRRTLCLLSYTGRRLPRPGPRSPCQGTGSGRRRVKACRRLGGVDAEHLGARSLACPPKEPAGRLRSRGDHDHTELARGRAEIGRGRLAAGRHSRVGAARTAVRSGRPRRRPSRRRPGRPADPDPAGTGPAAAPGRTAAGSFGRRCPGRRVAWRSWHARGPRSGGWMRSRLTGCAAYRTATACAMRVRWSCTPGWSGSPWQR